MRKTREILRQKWELGRSHREIARSVSTSAGAVGAVLARAKEAGLTTWPEVEGLSEDELDRALYPQRASNADPRPEPMPSDTAPCGTWPWSARTSPMSITRDSRAKTIPPSEVVATRHPLLDRRRFSLERSFDDR